MNKAEDLIAAVELLRERFGDDVAVNDHWDADQLAIGLCRNGQPERLAYLSMTPGKEARFYVALELPPRPGSDAPYHHAGEHSDLCLDEVMQVVGRHLGLA